MRPILGGWLDECGSAPWNAQSSRKSRDAASGLSRRDFWLYPRRV
ncbi:MAG: hypothetical protein ABI870_07030 [Rhodanobacter sp.]